MKTILVTPSREKAETKAYKTMTRLQKKGYVNIGTNIELTQNASLDWELKATPEIFKAMGWN